MIKHLLDNLLVDHLKDDDVVVDLFTETFLTYIGIFGETRRFLLFRAVGLKLIWIPPLPSGKTNIAMGNPPFESMYLLLKMVVKTLAMLVYREGITPLMNVTSLK